MKVKITKLNNISICTREDRHCEDWSVVGEVLQRDCYKIKYIKNFINPPKVILDIGGHIGTFGLLVKSIWPEALLIAVEPNKDSHYLYSKNMSVNKYKNWYVLNKGISYDKSKTYLLDGPNATGGCILANKSKAERIASKGRYHIIENKIETVTIEDIVNLFNLKQIDLIKWDCEGSERNALKNLNSKTKEIIKNMLGEFHILKGDRTDFVKEYNPYFPNLYFITKPTRFKTIGPFWAFLKELNITHEKLHINT